MQPQPIWYGTSEEHRDLLAAVERNCMCVFDVKGARDSVCEAHTMLVQRQRVLNGLLFARRIAKRFIREEWLRGNPAAIGSERLTTVRNESDPVVTRS